MDSPRHKTDNTNNTLESSRICLAVPAEPSLMTTKESHIEQQSLPVMGQVKV